MWRLFAHHSLYLVILLVQRFICAEKRVDLSMGAKPSISKEMRSHDEAWSESLFENPEQEEDDDGEEEEEERAESEELTVSFGYYCKSKKDSDSITEMRNYNRPPKTAGSFSCLLGAALSANATLANTRICNGILGQEILPCLDSPKTFRRLKFESPPQSSSCSSLSTLKTGSSTSQSDILDDEEVVSECGNFSCITETSFLNASDVQTAGGAAGEDRVQAVCSEENGWLFCAIYDGFNGRDAADFLAATLYENIAFYLRLLEWQMQKKHKHFLGEISENLGICSRIWSENQVTDECPGAHEEFQQGVLTSLQKALAQTEHDFLGMVEQEMEERADLAMVGSCVLVVLLYGENLYTLNLGDSRSLLATSCTDGKEGSPNFLGAVQLTEQHVVNEISERERVLAEHPDDPSAIVSGRIKGKLNLTRAFGAGYLKKVKFNNALMGILRVQDLFSPPYISSKPSLNVRRISKLDRFIVLGSDGLFDFFSNEEVVEYLDKFILENQSGDPAKYMLEQVLLRAAENAGMTIDQLKSIPSGRRRKYHDDVTIVIVVLLGKVYQTSSASTSM